MRKYALFLCFMLPIYIFSQNIVEWKEDFSDGNFSDNPMWSGMTDNFTVNTSFQLQSKAAAASKSYLSTPSEVFDNAVWEFWVKINYNPSSANYAIVYLIADRADLSNEVFGYYVQIGNAADEIALYVQEGAKKTKIIDGTDGRTNSNPAEVRVRVIRDKEGNFMLYSKLPSETDYYSEGSVQNMKVTGSKYFGALYSNSSLTGNAYFFDDISVKGEKFLDMVPPVWTNISLVEPDKLILTFSESIDFSAATFRVDNGIGEPATLSVSSDKYSATLTFSARFEKGKIYTVDALGIRDFSGNSAENTRKQVGIVENIGFGDLVINEILFEPTLDVPEYFEVYNNSAKILDLSRVSYGVRKSDGSYTPANFFPMKTLILPKQYLAIATDAEKIRTCYHAPDSANILSVNKWSALNNSSASLLIANAAADTIYDEVRYDAKWHHPLVKNRQGVSLERISPFLPSQSGENWHSAASEVYYGTPGCINSQYRELHEKTSAEKQVWTEPEVFTPDNDGTDDVCFIRYKTESSGFTGNVIIFNAVGVKIKQIVSNQLLSSEGFFTWDGRTERGENVNPGIYVLYFEMINVNSGVKKTEKLPVVVSAR